MTYLHMKLFAKIKTLTVFAADPTTKKQDSVETDEEDAALEKELNDELKSFEVSYCHILSLLSMAFAFHH